MSPQTRSPAAGHLTGDAPLTALQRLKPYDNKDFTFVIKVPGRDPDADLVKHADALIVRSITKVTEALLAGSRVRFVGTATIGVDISSATLAAPPAPATAPTAAAPRGKAKAR